MSIINYLFIFSLFIYFNIKWAIKLVIVFALNNTKKKFQLLISIKKNRSKIIYKFIFLINLIINIFLILKKSNKLKTNIN